MCIRDRNYTYFNQEAKPEQNSGSIQVLSASLNQDFKLGIFHLDNEVTWQKYSLVTGFLPGHLIVQMEDS